MAHFRQSRFRSRGEVGEDVNPSAYIGNLADCMLVLACGFMVALISYWEIDMTPAEELDSEQLEEVDPEEIPEDVIEGGSYYVEAGTVYQDPNTGQLYIVQGADGDDASGDSSGESSSSNGDASGGSSGSTGSTDASASSADDDAVRNARAAGAD